MGVEHTLVSGCCACTEEEELANQALLKQLRRRVATKEDPEKYEALMRRHAEAEKLSDSMLAQVSALKTERDKSPRPGAFNTMLWPTAVSTERKYERHIERKYGKKKITPNF